MKYDWIIIGGGASGLMLAAKKKVNRGLILEGTGKLGSKLLLTGGGHCNLTHTGSIKDFVNCYGDAGKLMRKALYKHNNLEMIEWLNGCGLTTMEQDDRFYPASLKSQDVLDTLLKQAKNNGWEIKFNSKVSDIKSNDDSWFVKAGEQFLTDNVVIACGGITYPETGSDGSIFPIINKLGVEIVPPKSALTSVDIKDYPYADLAGISIPNVTVTAFSSDVVNTCKGKASRLTGDLLFTHTGFSGPVILNISRYCEVGEAIRISYNKTIEDLPNRLKKALENRSRGVSGDIKTTVLAGLLESDNFIVKGLEPNGIVTAGGISLDEIDLSNMELKNNPGIYAIGEAIDVDGQTGGYNLQMCYSTASLVADIIK